MKPIGQYLPTAQTVSNILIMFFTGILAFIGYVTERPQVAVLPTPIQNFTKGGLPREMVFFQNIGHQSADSFVCGIAIAVFQYPLGDIHLTEVPPNGFPIDLSSGTVGRPVDFQQPLTDADFEAVSDGKNRQIYVWGTIKYSDFFRIPHYQNFCFAFGGANATHAGVCSVERPQQFYIAEQRGTQEPHAQPIPVPMRSAP